MGVSSQSVILLDIVTVTSVFIEFPFCQLLNFLIQNWFLFQEHICLCTPPLEGWQEVCTISLPFMIWNVNKRGLLYLTYIWSSPEAIDFAKRKPIHEAAKRRKEKMENPVSYCHPKLRLRDPHWLKWYHKECYRRCNYQWSILESGHTLRIRSIESSHDFSKRNFGYTVLRVNVLWTVTRG